MNIEQTILRNLLTNPEFMRKALPYIKPEYFEGIYNPLFIEVAKFVAKYNKLPTEEAFTIELNDTTALNDEQFSVAMDLVPALFQKEEVDSEWLFEKSEKWCQDRSVFLAIMDSIAIFDGKHKSLTKNAIPDLLTKALGVSFDTNIGHDYLENVENRYEFYHKQEEKVPFDLDIFNQITKGGLPNKTLNICLAGTGVGKSLFMCHGAAANLSMSKNVLYITLEMAEERIAERIDANLLDIPIDQIENMNKDMFSNAVGNIKAKTNGKLIIKEYPTSSANASHFRALLNELRLKKKFIPDVIYIDYLNICASSRMKKAGGGGGDGYAYIKAIAEELRGLAVEFNVPIISATQTTRSGYGNSDPGLEDTSESFGLPATADFMFALISNEELEESNQVMVKQLKNRYNDPSHYKRFVLDIDRSKMRLSDADNGSEGVMQESNPYTNSGFTSKDFKGIKV